MKLVSEWYDGINDYRYNTLYKEDDRKSFHYKLDIIDQHVDENKSITDIFYDHIKHKQTSKVEMLYSGGVDSEFVLLCLMKLQIPIVAVTMRLLFKGCPLNTHDLYYSEKFCRENNLTQKFIDLDIVKFYDNEYLNYLKPYNINYFHIATHFWLLTQCDYFPIIGGNHTWPWVENEPVLSPLRYQNILHDKFMKDNSINGIGNMMLYSYESNYLITKNQVELYKENPNNNYGGDPSRIIQTKVDLYEKIEPTIKIVPRVQTYGWENILPVFFDRRKHELILAQLMGNTNSTISWGKKMAEILGGNPGSNARFR